MGLELVLLTDFHYGFPADKNPEKYIEPVLESMVAEINEKNPEMVIGMGDFIQHKNPEKDVERINEVSGILSELESDFYAIPGNHDVINLDSKEVLDLVDAENSEPCFSIETEDLKLIFLDTTHRNEDLDSIGGYLGKNQLNWLEDELVKDKKIYIFSHHLLHYRDLSTNWYFDEKTELAVCQDKREFNKLIEDFDVEGIFSAHIHEEGLSEFKGIPHVTMKAMDKYNPPEKFQKYMAEVELREEGFSYLSDYQEHSTLNAL